MADEAEAGWGDANISQLTGRNAPAGRIGRLEVALGHPIAECGSSDPTLAGAGGGR